MSMSDDSDYFMEIINVLKSIERTLEGVHSELTLLKLCLEVKDDES